MPTHRQAGSTRERIVDAADQAIRDHGSAGATTKRIARLADCSEALLYKHFSSKEELFLAVLLERMPALAPALGRLHRQVGNGDLVENLAEFARAAVEFYAKAAPIAAGVMTEPSLMTGFRAMLAESHSGPHKPIEALAACLGAERNLGRIRASADVGAMASLLMGACYHRAHLSYFVDPPDTVEQFATSIANTLVS